MMITALVQIKPSAPLTRDKAQEILSNVAPRFRDVPGLIRKYFLRSEDGGIVGGVYLWKSRADADRFYDGGFRQSIFERYGSEPSVTYFESPVVVDNLEGETITAG